MRHIQEVLRSELVLTAIPASSCLASFPGSRAGEEEREPGTHCLRMRQVPLVTCILLHSLALDNTCYKGYDFALATVLM